MLEARFLGKYEVRLNSQPIDLPSRPAQSLLAYLLLNPNQAIRRGKLAGLLWSDSTESNARSNLRHALWRVRKSFGSDGDAYFHADDLTTSLQLQRGDWVDANILDTSVQDDVTADQLIEIVSAYGGELLPGFYEDWVAAERERLKTVFEQKMDLLLDRLVAESRWEGAIEWGERWISLGFTPEHAYRAMMIAHAGLGDIGKAAATYRRCILALERDLDIEASEQTQELYQSLVQGRLAEVIPQTKLVKTGITKAGSAKLKSNLPHFISKFVGRSGELEDLKRLIEDGRLVTLTGAGGSGKTRLAVRAASDLMSEYREGVWFVDLAPLSNPEEVYPAVACVLDIHETHADALPDLLVNNLYDKRVLLVLDNCEHLIQVCAELTENLLLNCPHLHILATSRESLGIAGEMNWNVPPLTLPDTSELDPAELMKFDAIQLFIERMSSSHPIGRSPLKEEHWQAIVKICSQLDGLPLAIELAAARTNILSVQEIADRLQDRFELLRGGSRTSLPRQRTLQGTIDWSYQLLSEKEQIVFQRLSVFSGGWSLEAAEDVTGEAEGAGNERESKQLSHGHATVSVGRAEVLDLLSQLVNKSLVVREPSAGEKTRHRMLESIREYARARLRESNEQNRVRTSHLDFFIRLVESAEPELRGPDRNEWVNCLEQDYDNVKAAIAWAINGNQEPGKGLRLVGSLKQFWDTRGSLSEARHLAKSVLSQAGDQRRSLAGAKTLLLAGWYAAEQEDMLEADSYLQESLEICLEIGPAAEPVLASVLVSQGIQALLLKDFESGISLVKESLKIRRALDDPEGIANSLAMLGEFASSLGNLGEARAFWLEALEFAKTADEKRITAIIVGSLGEVSEKMGAFDEALRYYTQSLRIAQKMRDYYLAGMNLFTLASVKVSQEPGKHVEEAIRIFGAAKTLHRKYGARLSGISNYEEIEWKILSLRESLGGEFFDAAYAEGEAMDFDQAVAFALSQTKLD